MDTVFPSLSLGTRLRAHRAQYGMTQPYVAGILRVSDSVVSQLEHDAVVSLPRPVVTRLAALLGCPPAALGIRVKPGLVRYRTPHPRVVAADCGTPLGVAVRTLRLAQGWTQAMLARRAQLHPTAVSRLECGRTHPSRATIRRLADAFHVAPTRLTRPTPSPG